MVVTPDSTIRLLKCPIKLDDKNQLTFSTLANQTTYFESLPYLSDTNLSYIRKDGVIRIGTSEQVTFEDVIQYNYCMYKNTHYDNKWFYAYVTNVEYKNDGCTEVTIDTDVYQTWLFDADFKTSFIEREHVNDDTVGKHTIPENLEHGEYVMNGYQYESGMDSVIYLLGATTDVDGGTTRSLTNLNGIPYQGYVFAFSDPSDLATLVRGYDSAGIPDNIYGVWMACRYSIENVPNPNNPKLDDSTIPILLPWTFAKPTTLNNYTPKNNKVKTFPYQYLLVSNNNGTSNILKYEGWSGNNCTFEVQYTCVVGGDVKLTPTNYEVASTHSEMNSLTGGKYPTLSWSRDGFTNWLSQNAVNIGIGQATSALSIAGGIALLATGGGAVAGAGLIAGGVGGIANSMMTQYQHTFEPTSARGNTNAGSINVCAKRNGFYGYKMSIKQEYAQMIDDYFSMFGYKVNRIGLPHIHVRSNWDYCKTIDIHLAGNIPEGDMQKLRDLFNNGCTFWHNPTTFMDYSQTNSII